MRIQNKREPLPEINERIRATQVQLITHDGKNLGVITKAEALQLARAEGLDLVLISERGSEVPLAKIMDFGKALYDKKKKQSESKKKQKVIKVKEVKLRPKIDKHDYETKLNQGIAFLEEGKRLKVTVMFRGRENVIKHELGPQMFDRVQQTLAAKFGADNLIAEGDSRAGNSWSKFFYLKPSKR